MSLSAGAQATGPDGVPYKRRLLGGDAVITVLNPGSSTGFILPLDDGTFTLVDMEPQYGETLKEAFNRVGVEPAGITLTLLTHLHSDHFSPEGAKCLLEQSECVFVAGSMPRESVMKRGDEYTSAVQSIEKAGRLRVVDEPGEAEFAGHNVVFAPLAHGLELDGTIHPEGNIAFRVGDVLISGDTTVGELFSERAAALRRAGVKTFCIDLAQLDAEDLQKQDTPELRKRRWSSEHGMVGDLLEVMGGGEYREFFAGLRTLIPCHVRRHPEKESKRLFVEMIAARAKELGYSFAVTLDGL